MKKFVILILAVLLVGTMLIACVNNGSGNDVTPTPSDEPTPTSSKDVTPTPIPTPTSAPTPIPSDKAAFTGTAEEILNQLISKTVEKKVVAEEELGGIKCYCKNVDADSCQDILGLTPDEFAADVEAAIESKPEGSWFAHSIVVIKSKTGVDAAALADKISKGTNPARFGCIKAETVVVGQAGQYILLCASFQTTSDAIYSTFSELSAVTANRIDRENDWSDGGMLG